MKPISQVAKSDRGHQENNEEQIISVIRLMFKIVQCTVNQIIRKDDFRKRLLSRHCHFFLFLIALYYDIISFFSLLSLLHLPSSLENLSGTPFTSPLSSFYSIDLY
jgi:hypothetical protein